MKDEKVLDKIKKLFALAGNNPNENESMVAMKAAKKMLDKHNLSVYDLKQQDDIGLKIEGEINMPYVRVVYNAVAKLYDCKIVLDKTVKPMVYLIIGTESNRVTASIVIKYVLQITRDKAKGLGAALRNGIATGVYHNVNSILEERNASKEEVIPGTGLVPADASKIMEKDIQDYQNKTFGKLGKGQRSNSSFDSRGVDIGKGINLGAHLSNKRALS